MKQKHNHLFHLENTQENRDLIKAFNKNMKAHNSKWKFRIKYRKPKEGQKYGWGGSLKRENAREFAVYLNGTYNNEEMMAVHTRAWKANDKVRITKEKVDLIEEYVDRCYYQIQNVKELLENE